MHIQEAWIPEKFGLLDVLKIPPYFKHVTKLFVDLDSLLLNCCLYIRQQFALLPLAVPFHMDFSPTEKSEQLENILWSFEFCTSIAIEVLTVTLQTQLPQRN